MTEQERPRTEAGPIERLRQLVLAVARDEPLEVYESAAELSGLYDKALEAARTEGRQQAVREIRAEISKGLQGDVQAALYRLAESPMAHRGHDESRSHPECIACQRVAGLNASESPPTLPQHFVRAGQLPEVGDASESPPTCVCMNSGCRCAAGKPCGMCAGGDHYYVGDASGSPSPGHWDCRFPIPHDGPCEPRDASESGQPQEASDE